MGEEGSLPPYYQKVPVAYATAITSILLFVKPPRFSQVPAFLAM